MPPQGYYGKATTQRKKRRSAPVRSGPPKGRPGSGIKRPPRSAPSAPLAQPVAPPSASGMNQGMQGAANAGLAGGAGGYDINSDPAVAAAQGLAQKMRAVAQASALAKRKQAAIEYGDPSGVEGIDEATSKAARENPFSMLKNLEHGYKTGVDDLEEGLNKNNLFYSGYRGKQLGEAARGYQDSRYQAGTRFKGLMTDVNDQLANALMNADAYESSAIMGSDGGYYGGGGGDGGGSSSYRVPYDPNTSLGPAARRLVAPRARTQVTSRSLYAGLIR